MPILLLCNHFERKFQKTFTPVLLLQNAFVLRAVSLNVLKFDLSLGENHPRFWHRGREEGGVVVGSQVMVRRPVEEG